MFSVSLFFPSAFWPGTSISPFSFHVICNRNAFLSSHLTSRGRPSNLLRSAWPAGASPRLRCPHKTASRDFRRLSILPKTQVLFGACQIQGRDYSGCIPQADQRSHQSPGSGLTPAHPHCAEVRQSVFVSLLHTSLIHPQLTLLQLRADPPHRGDQGRQLLIVNV